MRRYIFPVNRPLIFVALALFPAARLPAHGADEVMLRRLNARIADAPNDGALFFERAELWRAGGHRDAAFADYKTARRLSPGLAAIDLGLAAMWLDAGEPPASLEASERFLARAPGHPDALITRARALARLRRDREADLAYAAALAAMRPPRDPQPELFLEHAEVLMRGAAPDAARALGVLDAGIARLGEAITFQLKAIEIETARGNPAGALARLDRVIARSPRPEIWREKRAALARRAQPPGAPPPPEVANYPEIVRTSPPTPGGMP